VFDGGANDAAVAVPVSVAAVAGGVDMEVELGVSGYHEGRCLVHLSGTSTSFLFTL
jgi:hypothetical protein